MKNESAHDRESLGQMLRRIRTEQGLSFEEAVESTKISPNNLRALEEDDYASLPAEAFVIGFYGIYARYLSLDPEDIRQRFHQQKKLLPKKPGKRSPTPGQLAIQTSSMAEPPSVASHSIIGLSVLALIVIGVATCWYFSWNPATYLSQKLRGVTEQPATTDGQPVPDAPAPAAPAADASPQAPATASLPAAAVPAGPATGGTAVQEELAPNTAAAGSPSTASPAAGTTAAPAANAYTLKASFKEPTRLTIKIDDKPSEQLSFAAGTVQTWNAGKSIIISLPAGSGASLTLNDLPLALPKKAAGEEMTISIPEYLLE